MSSARFKYIDRGKVKTLVLLPGWAADTRIFSRLDLEYNYLMPENFSPFTFAPGLMAALKENKIKQAALFGWSQGGFAAADFAGQHPGFIQELIFVGIRQRYPRREIEQVRQYLVRNKKAYLYRFYTRCFHKQENMSWFRQNLLKAYCRDFALDGLLKGLDYLAQARIDTEALNDVPAIKIIHGEHDRVAPVVEAKAVAASLSQAEFVVRDCGHIPFLEEGFCL